MPSSADTDEITDEEREHWRQVRIKGIERDGAVRRVECPRCSARVGEDCHSPKWYSVGYHVDRLRLAGVT